ncbi:MAG: lipoprotein-releasing ABC transporter permease subunit [Alphaproteobacteria bacterium]|nr:lipoprotein-releasing ABC transporter permease subunit [Alphaproteobacteria bacterium]
MAFSLFERVVAFRYLKPRREEGFISIIAAFSLLGITLGVATLIIVMSVMNGFRHELLGKILGLNGHINLVRENGPLTDYDALIQKLSSVPNIVSIKPMIQGQAMITSKGHALGGIVRGTRAADWKPNDLLVRNIKAGDLYADGAMIGTKLAKQLGVKVGDSITLITPQTVDTVIGSIPRSKTFEVTAIFEVGMYDYDSGYVFVPLSDLQLYYKMPNAASYLEIVINNPDLTNQVIKNIQNTLLSDDYGLQDWQRLNGTFFNAIQVERNVMFLILTLIIVVAAFNIICGQIMLVKDKGRDIAILRTMGATKSMIMRIFLLSGASIGVAGTITGLILGILFADNIESIRKFLERLSQTNLFSDEIYFLSKLPAIIDFSEVTLVGLMALTLSLLATIYPSWRAAKLDPVEALRYE